MNNLDQKEFKNIISGINSAKLLKTIINKLKQNKTDSK